MITADTSCRLLETFEGLGRPSWDLGVAVYTKVFPTQGAQRVSETYLRRTFGDLRVDAALRAKVLIRDAS